MLSPVGGARRQSHLQTFVSEAQRKANKYKVTKSSSCVFFIVYSLRVQDEEAPDGRTVASAPLGLVGTTLESTVLVALQSPC